MKKWWNIMTGVERLMSGLCSRNGFLWDPGSSQLRRLGFRGLLRGAVLSGLFLGSAGKILEAKAPGVPQENNLIGSGSIMVTVTLSSVAAPKPPPVALTRPESDPSGSMVWSHLSSGTPLEFFRVNPEAANTAIQWCVVELASDVKIQRGGVALKAPTVNVSIDPVAALSQAFVLWSLTPSTDDKTWNSDHSMVGELTDRANLQFRANGINSEHVIARQVIEFTDPSGLQVQKGSTFMASLETSTRNTLGIAVDVSKSLLVLGFRGVSDRDMGPLGLRARLTDPTTLTVDRDFTAGSLEEITEIVWRVIEFKDGSRIQKGTEDFPEGVLEKTVTIHAVDMSRAVAFALVQPLDGQDLGHSFRAGDERLSPELHVVATERGSQASVQSGHEDFWNFDRSGSREVIQRRTENHE